MHDNRLEQLGGQPPSCFKDKQRGGQIQNNQIWLEVNNQFWLMQYTRFGYLWATIRKKEG
ncbi:hypothetical protein D6V26_20005 [Vibrio cholerae]|nr:hypothetical protein [Vibrio cholerae]